MVRHADMQLAIHKFRSLLILISAWQRWTGGAAQTANESGLTPAPADALGALAQQPPIDAAAADALQAQQARSTEGSGAMPIIILALAIL